MAGARLKTPRRLTLLRPFRYLLHMGYPIRIEPAISQPIAVVRRRVAPDELSKVVPETCGLVWRTLKAAQVTSAGRHVAVYRDAGGGQLDVEVGVEVSTPFAGRGEVVGSVTPTGDAATVAHFGPYSTLGNAHQAIRLWCAAHGRTVTGTTWEIYDHWKDEWNNDPSRIRTDVFHLLRR